MFEFRSEKNLIQAKKNLFWIRPIYPAPVEKRLYNQPYKIEKKELEMTALP